MRTSLAFLLSRYYDGALAPEHLADLRKSGLTDEIIAEQFFRSVPPGMISRLLAFEAPQISSALLFPYRSPAGGFMDHVRVKVFPSFTGRDGQTTKYLQPRNSTPRVYFVMRCLREVLDGTDPLWVVEGEKKAAAVAQLGLPAIGIAGVEGWHGKGQHRLLPDFDVISLRKRTVEVVPDGDVERNFQVRRAVEALGLALAARGAVPRLVHLPHELAR